MTEFFNEIDHFINNHHEKITNSAIIKFFQVTIPRDTDHKIINWIITKNAYSISHSFNKESQGVIKVKQILFTSEQTGLVLFENSPDGKSSVYYFNLTNKFQPLF